MSTQQKEGAAEKQQGRQRTWEGGKGRWGNGRATVLLSVSSKPCRHLTSSSGQGLRRTPSGPFFASQQFLQGCLVQTKASSLPLAALADREQFNSSACFTSWHWRSRWEDILAQLEESVLSLGVLFFFFFFLRKKQTTVNVSNTKLGCS